MPEVAAPPAPAAAPAAPASQPAAAARTTINVSALPRSGEAEKPAKPGSARSKISEALHKRFDTDEKPAPKPAAAKEEAAPAERPGEEETPPAAAGEETTPTETPTADDGKGKKISTGKLIEMFKQRAHRAEARALELEKAVVPKAKLKELHTRMQDYENRIQEMTEDLRFHNAEKYDPDIKKLDADQTATWNRAMKELGEISLKDPTSGEQRAVTADDLLELVKLPLGRAREISDEVFGKFSDDVMAHRKAIRELFDQRSAKLEELKKTGSTREQERQQKFLQSREQLQQFTKTTYEKANQEAAADPNHGHFFRTREGQTDADKEWNARLEKGFKLVDDAYNANSMDPRLTPEQRADVIRKHAAVRNRAAAFGPLRHENERLRKQIEKLEADLKGYTSTTPSAGGRGGPAPKEELKGMDRLRAGLRELAH
jgi:hypothetical protein